MALSAHWIPRWFNSIPLNGFVTATQLRNRFQRPGKTLLHGFAAQPQISSDSCFLRWGFKTYRTFSVWNNSSQSTNSSRQESNSAQSTVLSSVNEQSQTTQKIPNFDCELSLEGNSELSEKSLLPHFGSLNKLPVYIINPFQVILYQARKVAVPFLVITSIISLFLLKRKVCRLIYIRIIL